MLNTNDSTIDQTMPSNKWVFDESVTDVFEDMLRRSIPQYDVMRETTTAIAKRYLHNGALLDLGCSRGDMIAPFADTHAVVGIDVSEPMLEVARQRFMNQSHVTIQYCDIRHDFPSGEFDVTLAVLTLQFTPIEYRLSILNRIRQSTRKAFILVEKVIGASAEIDELMVSEYYDLKAHNGYTQEQIQRKRLSLEGVLVPVTAKWNEELLRMSGFNQVDCFWRWQNFAGWIAL